MMDDELIVREGKQSLGLVRRITYGLHAVRSAAEPKFPLCLGGDTQGI
jgi:hypothetical protein